MTSETLQRAIGAQPFRPFTLRLADGREVHVSHPELIAHLKGARTAVVVRGDEFEAIDLLLVVSLNGQIAAGAAGGEGSR